MPSKTANQIREDLNLDPTLTELNVEQGMVDQGLVEEDQPNEPPVESDEVESKESDYSNHEGPRRRETLTKLTFKSKYLQFNCEKNLQLGIIGTFIASLDVSIRRKVWERESLPTKMIKLLDVVI